MTDGGLGRERGPSPQATARAGAMAEPTIAPFAGWLVKPEWADRVISRAHDHMSAQERRAIMATNPYSYVNVTRSSDDVTERDLSVEDLVEQSGAALTRLLDEPVFEPTGRPALYLYRMTDESSSQTGIVGTVPLSGFADRSIRVHENVRDDRTELLTRHLLGIGATSTPVAMTLRAPDGLEEAMAEIVAAAPPDLEFGSTAVHHQIWTAPDEWTEPLAELVEGRTLYVTDGHHRSAAARRALASDPADPALARILAVVFPHDQLRVTSFHRLVADRSRRPGAEVLAALSEAASVESVMAAEEAWPRRKGELGLYAAWSWHRLSLPAPEDASAVARLDVERLRRGLIDPILGADELGGDGAVDYLPETAGLGELVRRCGAEDRLGFVVHPMSVGELMAVADEGALMPPKSSFFTPKPRAGAFLRVLGRGPTAHLPPS